MKAYELLDKPEKWTQGAFGEDEAGNAVGSRCPTAVCWCMAGAINRCYGTECDEFHDKVKAKLGGLISVVTWNDAPSRTWQEVHAILKELDI